MLVRNHWTQSAPVNILTPEWRACVCVCVCVCVWCVCVCTWQGIPEVGCANADVCVCVCVCTWQGIPEVGWANADAYSLKASVELSSCIIIQQTNNNYCYNYQALEKSIFSWSYFRCSYALSMSCLDFRGLIFRLGAFRQKITKIKPNEKFSLYSLRRYSYFIICSSTAR